MADFPTKIALLRRAEGGGLAIGDLKRFVAKVGDTLGWRHEDVSGYRRASNTGSIVNPWEIRPRSDETATRFQYAIDLVFAAAAETPVPNAVLPRNALTPRE